MPVKVGQNFSADCNTFYELWKRAEGTDRIPLIPKLSFRQVKDLKNMKAFTDEELVMVKKIYNEAFCIKEFTQDDLVYQALNNSADYIRWIKNYDHQFVERWLGNFGFIRLKESTLLFVLRSKVFTLEDKLLVIYRQTFESDRELTQKHVSSLLQCAHRHCKDSAYNILLALVIKPKIMTDDPRIIKDMIIQAMDFTFKNEDL